jgi:hypothetical protein
MAIIEEQLQEVQVSKSEHGETLHHLSSDEFFKKISVLVDYEQAYAFATLWSIAEENNIIFLKNWLKSIADWNISVNARGRTDIVEVSKFKGEKTLSWNEKFLEIMGKR